MNVNYVAGSTPTILYLKIPYLNKACRLKQLLNTEIKNFRCA